MASCGVRGKLRLDAHSPIVVFCGRLNQVKGWEFALDAFKVFLLSVPNATMLFIGDGEDRSAALRKVAHLRLEKRVCFVGNVRGEDVASYLSAANVVVVCSFYEGWSQAMLEALACGKPVVSTDVSGARELISEGENGYVLAAREPRLFAAAMVDALSLPNVEGISLRIAQRYALSSLATDLRTVWPAIAAD
jgi:glycosyltransferase involved in cell wall biosynthesis